MDVILLDVDGVLADFHGGALRLIHELFGLERTLEDFKNWDYTSVLDDESQKEIMRREIVKPGFIANLDPYPGAEECVAQLRDMAEVVCISSPNHRAPTWAQERYEWLRDVLDFPLQDVILTNRKDLVPGSILVDDHPKTVIQWQNRWQKPLPEVSYLWDRPYNRNAVVYPRLTSFDNLMETVEYLL
jgi:5'(3')-deoxyribonucleotidase